MKQFRIISLLGIYFIPVYYNFYIYLVSEDVLYTVKYNLHHFQIEIGLK